MAGFLLLIVAGALLLMVFNARTRPLRFVDALFTSTSAVCVTGLVVVDTGKDLAPASQAVVLLLIQLGGIGVMTATTALSLLMRERIGLRQRMFFAGGFGMETPAGVVRFLRRILLLTFTVEAAGTVFLFAGFLRAGFSPLRALCNAVFHSISAFCNAGFSLFSDSLAGFSRTFLIPGTVMALIVVGGLGFMVLSELMITVRRREKLSMLPRLVLFTTAGLLLFGLFSITLSEWNHAFAGMSGGWKIWNGLFASVTPRTAGFDTVPPATFSSAGIFILVLLMIIGASPGSTGGGFKTTTLAVLLVSTWNNLRKSPEINLWNRRISIRILQRTVTVVVLYLGTIGLGLAALSLLEPFSFRSLFFETVSAMGTVGLSLGITPELSDAGKIVLMLLMFWGRVGIVTFLYGLLKPVAKGKVSYPDAEIPIG